MAHTVESLGMVGAGGALECGALGGWFAGRRAGG